MRYDHDSSLFRCILTPILLSEFSSTPRKGNWRSISSCSVTSSIVAFVSKWPSSTPNLASQKDSTLFLAVGVIGGLAATWSAMNVMLGAEFSPPCYAGIFRSAPAVLDNATIPFRYGVHFEFPNTHIVVYVRSIWLFLLNVYIWSCYLMERGEESSFFQT